MTLRATPPSFVINNQYHHRYALDAHWRLRRWHSSGVNSADVDRALPPLACQYDSPDEVIAWPISASYISRNTVANDVLQRADNSHAKQQPLQATVAGPTTPFLSRPPCCVHQHSSAVADLHLPLTVVTYPSAPPSRPTYHIPVGPHFFFFFSGFLFAARLRYPRHSTPLSSTLNRAVTSTSVGL